MKVLVVGGGSGGHITPAVAVVCELLKIKPRAKVEFWTDRKYYKNVVKITTEIGMSWGGEEKRQSAKTPYIRVRRVLAGKFNRYSGWKFADYFKYFDITLKKLIWGNLCGFFGFLGGFLQSFCRFILKKNRPDVIFCKGGFVCLPVGVAARIFGIPYIVHESDAVPGLANRLLMEKAKKVAFGATLEKESLMAHPNWEWVGIPVGEKFKPVSPSRAMSLKKTFGFDPEKPLVVITGGSQGSECMNNATREILPELLKVCSVALIAGRIHYEDMIDLKKYEVWDKAKLSSNFRLWEFSSNMDELMGAANVVVSRAGATTIAELAALKKAVILIPYERLPGSHQVKNAEKLLREEAASVILNEKIDNDPKLLLDEIVALVKNPRKCADMADKLHESARSDAAMRLAEIVIEVAEGEKR